MLHWTMCAARNIMASLGWLMSPELAGMCSNDHLGDLVVNYCISCMGDTIVKG